MQKKEFKFYIMGTLLMMVFSFITIEFATRTVFWLTGDGFFLALHEREPYDREVEGIYQWHPFIGFIFKPGVTFTGGHLNQQNKSLLFIDKHGFLSNGQTLKYEKSANEIRIAAIGGSTTANLNLMFDENWPGFLGALIQQKFPNKKVQVINAGAPGFDTAQSIVNLSLRVMPFKPDIVIIYHAYNDLKPINPALEFRPDYSHIHNTPFGYHEKPWLIIRWLNNSMFYVRTRNKYREYKKNIYLAESKLKVISGKDRFVNIPDFAADTYAQHMNIMVATARSGGAKVVLSSFATLHDLSLDFSNLNQLNQMTLFQKKTLFDPLPMHLPGLTLPAIFKGIEKYNTIVEGIATQKETGWVDNANLIPHEDRFFVDSIHFSRDGSKQMAKNFLPIVLEMLKK